MEQIKIIFFVLASFFGIEEGKIAADKTTVSVYPQNKRIEIIQEDLFTVIQSKKDSILVLEQWNNLLFWKERNTNWSKELNGFTAKNFSITYTENTIKPNLTLTYLKEEDLRALGIWYNAESNRFSINHIPRNNIESESGKLIDNYWNFDGVKSFSFTIEPFLKMSEDYKKFKVPLKELLAKYKKE
ncbi:MAG TPA: hypothetical protein EYO35_12525 [Flavobacteriaceae bacterium]|jgi:hypothetical protein|nr:hypothetical protein [Flavobacteriaceae bacterium]|tara:strand:+ start:29 stop:586 length:558 start_codon:yes stop_codon:yes gene_type:complete